jgi:AraC-like DNA-binding protein
MAFVAFDTESNGSINGLEVNPREILVSGVGTEGEVVVEPNYQSVLCLVSPAFISEQLRLRGWNWKFRVPSEIEALETDAEKVRAYFDLGKRVTEAATLIPRVFDDEINARIAAQDDIVESLMAVIAAGKPKRPVRRDRTRREYSKIVTSCETHCLDVGAERLAITGLCEITRVSERTLQYAFREILGMSPITYLKRLRLHRARKDLRHSVDTGASVTEIAMRWGFWHLGEFSRDYKDCFSELPSETLKHTPADGD